MFGWLKFDWFKRSSAKIEPSEEDKIIIVEEILKNFNKNAPKISPLTDRGSVPYFYIYANAVKHVTRMKEIIKLKKLQKTLLLDNLEAQRSDLDETDISAPINIDNLNQEFNARYSELLRINDYRANIWHPLYRNIDNNFRDGIYFSPPEDNTWPTWFMRHFTIDEVYYERRPNSEHHGASEWVLENEVSPHIEEDNTWATRFMRPFTIAGFNFERRADTAPHAIAERVLMETPSPLEEIYNPNNQAYLVEHIEDREFETLGNVRILHHVTGSH